ncbi:MAG: phage head closure protein [Synergistaceae bacterium]|jgi:SPP1 family predicted phage head-tail adaptor|nr:phage head closure protein [Synergistaceae bacterium]
MDRIVTLKEVVTTENDFGEQIETLIELVKVGSEITTGTLTAGTLYQITATEEDHFGSGVVAYDTFTAVGTETCDDNNKVKPVTLPATVWAERLELRGDERWNAQQVVAGISCKYRIRYRDDVGPMDVVIDADSREYDISAALELGRKEGLELIVSARGE